MKRLLGILLTAVMSITCIFSVAAYDSAYNPYILNTAATATESLKDNFENANEAFFNLFQGFAEEEQTARQASAASDNVGYTVGGVSADGFPDYYAGAYINTYGNLVVLLNDEVNTGNLIKSSAQRQAEQNVLSMAESENITFGSATYSYSELVDVMTEITNFCNQMPAARPVYTIKSYEIDDYDNCINVYLNVLSPASIQWFQQNVSDAECIEFYLQDTEIREQSNNLGDRITADIQGRAVSIGFRAKTTGSNTRYGFITCAHGINNHQSTVSIKNNSGVQIAFTDALKLQYSGSVDAVFCELSPGQSISNKVAGIYTMSTSTILGPAQGAVVYAYGQASGTRKSGTITSLSTTITMNNRTWTDLYRSSIVTINGDSGGPLFGEYGNIYAVAGIVKGGDSVANSYFCKGINIQSALGIFVN